MLLINGNIFTGHGFQRRCVRLEEGRVAAVEEQLQPEEHEETLDLHGDYLVPGYVDVHIHACMGQDTMSGEQAVRAMSRWLYQQGVSAFCPTTMSAPLADTRRAIAGIRAVMERPEPQGALVMGAHMEAPFLSEKKAGAQKSVYFTDPSMEALREMTDGDLSCVRLITIAPERSGSEAFIRSAVEAGIHVSIGHTAADAETVHQAAEWGADHVTHTFNAQTPLLHRSPGVPGAALTDDRLYCEMICDGIHLHRDIVRMLARCKGAARAVAITDAMEAAGMPDGDYSLGGQTVHVRGPEARLSDGTLAGSVLTMRQALYQLIHIFDIDPADAVAMCTATPAASIGRAALGTIQSGSPLPLNRWSPEWQPLGIIC